MRVQYQREKRAKTMISKEIRIAKTLRCKASKPSYSRCHDCIKPSILSQLRDGRHSSRCPAEWIHFTQGWIFVLEAKLMGKEHIWKNCRYFCWVYLWQLYHTSEINYTYMHAWHLISINCWKWGSGVAKTVVGFFFFSTCLSIIPADPDISQPLEGKTTHMRLGRYEKSHFQLRYAWHSI